MASPAQLLRGRPARPPPPRLLALVLAALGLGAPLAAQNALYVQNGDKFSLVRRAVGSTPFVLEEGKWMADSEGKFVLQPAAEYLPVLLTVHNRYFKHGNRAISDDGPADDTIEYKGDLLVFSADLESPVALDDVFIMLAMQTDWAGDVLYLGGVGHLDAHRDRYISFSRQLPQRLGTTHMTLHVFVGGQEVFNSRIPGKARTAALNRMVAARIAARRDAEPQPLFTPPPAYPPELKAKLSGQAVIACEISPRGTVVRPVVASATDPAFAAAALAGVRHWRFVPKVAGGVAVEAPAEIPVSFEPPT